MSDNKIFEINFFTVPNSWDMQTVKVTATDEHKAREIFYRDFASAYASIISMTETLSKRKLEKIEQERLADINYKDKVLSDDYLNDAIKFACVGSKWSGQAVAIMAKEILELREKLK